MLEETIVEIATGAVAIFGIVFLIVSFKMGCLITNRKWSSHAELPGYIKYDGDVYKVRNETRDFVRVKKVYSRAPVNKDMVSDNGPTHMIVVSEPANVRSLMDAIGSRMAIGNEAFLILDLYRLDNKRFIAFCEHKGKL